MTGYKCIVCKVVAVLAGVGALNWGLYAFLGVDIVAKILGDMTLPAKVIYGLVGISGLLTLIMMIKPCPCAHKG